MAYIGKTPTPAALTASDITDGIISTDKLADTSVTTAKLGDTAVTNAKLNADLISAETELATSPADTDEFLISDAGVLKRIDASLVGGGGSWVLIDTQTVSSGTPASIGTGAVFSSTYDTYVLVFRRFKLNSNVGLQLRLGNSSGYTAGTSYRWSGSGVKEGSSLVTGSSGDSVIDLTGGSSSTYHINTTQDCFSGVIWIHNPYNSNRTGVHGEFAWENASGTESHINNVSAHAGTNTSYDRWVLYPSSDYFAATTIIQTFGVINA